MDKRQHEYIDDYFNDRLTADERKLFADRRANDPGFEAEVEDYLRSKGVIAAMARHAIHEQVKASYHATKKARRLTLGRVSAAAAIGLILVIAGIVVSQRPATPEKLYAEYYEIPVPSGVRDGSSSMDTDWSKAVESYATQDYAQALELFRLITEDQGPARLNEARLYMGISLMELGRFQEAIEEFNMIPDTNTFGRDALWYSALAYLQLNEIDAARDILESIANADEYRSIEARAMLEEL